MILVIPCVMFSLHTVFSCIQGHVTTPAPEHPITRGRGGQLIYLFSRLENHLQYDIQIWSALSLKNTRIVTGNSIFFTCITLNHAKKPPF